MTGGGVLEVEIRNRKQKRLLGARSSLSLAAQAVGGHWITGDQNARYYKRCQGGDRWGRTQEKIRVPFD